MNTQAFAKAIAAASAAGGGRVVVPKGAWLTGPIHLKSNVELHLADGAVIRFSREPSHYLPLVLTRWEGMELMNYSPFIYALDQENIAITGSGVIDGQADAEHWWPWKGKANFGWREGAPKQDAARARLFEMAEKGVPVAERRFGEGAYLRPQFIQPYRCRNVLIEGVSLMGSPMWQVHPVLCSSVIVRGLKITAAGPNTDGCDPESCRDVLIEDCVFDTGDDCIAIKAGRNADGRRLHTPSENFVIRNCRMKNGHGGVTVGSEITGGMRNLFVERCVMDSPDLNVALRFKDNALRGGVLENLNFRDITVGQVAQAVIGVEFNYEEGPNGPYRPVLRGLTVERLVSGKSDRPVSIDSYPSALIENITLKDCRFDGAAKPSKVANVSGLSLARVSINGAAVQTL